MVRVASQGTRAPDAIHTRAIPEITYRERRREHQTLDGVGRAGLRDQPDCGV
jgi:hypothetical protein